MFRNTKIILIGLIASLGYLAIIPQNLLAQSNAPGTNGIQTYVNPVLPGDHPDQTMMRIGKDFYTTGSNFHFTPYLPILHSTDMMHWEVVAKVIPANSSAVSNDKPQAGTWQGSLAEFGGKYWVYYSNNAGGGQYFCNATNMKGPWSTPVKVATNTGVYGYDNSIFVDDDGTPYMLLKNGQDLNGLQKLNPSTGQPNGQAINLNWVNSNGHPYSWAEGPVMCKRNGRYYMFVAGNVVGGQYTLSTADLTSGESGWTRHGNFWSNATSPAGFTGPNHITQPIKLDDGTWWCLSHAYDNAGWNGQGRQSHLNQVIWDGSNVPHGVPINSNPVLGPNLPSSNIPYDFGKADYFESTTLKLDWHFYNKSQATKYSLSERPGYLRLKPGTGNTYILQKDKGKVYSLTTKVDLNATANGQEAGLRMMNGWDDAYFNLYIGYNRGKKIGMDFNGTKTEVNNSIGNTVWLRIERNQHILTTFYSADGLSWTLLGTKDVTTLDASQHDYNAWVGTSVGLYSSNINADFDMYSHRFGFVPIKAEGRNNWYGTSISTKTPGKTVTNGATGDWMMLAGVDLGLGDMFSGGIEVNVASANSTSNLEVWMDNIGGSGTKLSTIAIPNTGGADVWKNVTASFNASGQHDIYLRFIGGANAFFVNTIRCLPNSGPIVSFTSPDANAVIVAGDPIILTAKASSSKSAIKDVKFYDGANLLNTDDATPYTFIWAGASIGTHTIKAVVTDNAGKTAESIITIKVNEPRGPYKGTWNLIPGTIQFENFDVGGNGFAYMDDSPGSAVTPVVNFRTTEDVDIETCTDAGGGYNLGYTTAGEWTEYSVDVQKAGEYTIGFRAACSGDARTLSLSMDGVDIAKDVAIPNTAGWQAWQTVNVAKVNLKAGKQILRMTIGATDYVNLNYLVFTLTKELKQEPYSGAVLSIPGKIEAEEYDLGGEGLAYHEGNTNGNEGLATLRNDQVDLENCTDAGAGYNIGYSLTGEWLEYTVNVSTTDKYNFQFRVAKDGTGGLFHAEIDGVNVTGSISVPNTGGWQMWQTVEVKNINLTAGTHIMKIVFDTDYTNFNYVDVKSVITGIEDVSLTSTQVYPNPFQNETVFEKEGLFTFEIIDSSGRIVDHGISIDKLIFGSSLETGSYLLRIIQKDKILVEKIIKF